ncbi:Piso0_001278 [Millerozyma farinosa CBS 7064]|uniref:Piso0_001278 protein n=1 Tax=Pichia sorbitophila (strain ATCC MYA-4447 / BCRC 22081 / CBS 7064 / NBRC 10061 / NRRL Y-12695) TaxID=559304 RepID=G8YDX9_PICSO|nr:Piso0_001278 [Millerozyma farinosa CBS 7064]
MSGLNHSLSQNGSAKNRYLNSSSDQEKYKTENSLPLSNPFENTEISSYSHKANIIPPYVLDTISQAHFKEQLNNSNVNVNNASGAAGTAKGTYAKKDDDEQYLSFANDPYVKTLNNNWHKLASSVRQANAFAPGDVTVDHNFNSDWKLDGTWGGETRLKSALVGPSSSDDDTYVADDIGCFSWWPLRRNRDDKKLQNSADNDNPKVRSKAGYWMSDEKRADVVPFLKRLFVQNPLIPLFLRILIIIFSVCALALACVIFRYSRRTYEGTKVEQQPSTIMAIVVQCFAIVYVIYIAYDEYSGKPLGLRNPLGKMKLIMLDLLFIIFSSANLSLAFNTLNDDEWVCKSNNQPALAHFGIYYPKVAAICDRQRALTSFLFLVLCLWVLTFTISIVRVVDRVNVTSPRGV